jgi:hypothetical protein
MPAFVVFAREPQGSQNWEVVAVCRDRGAARGLGRRYLERGAQVVVSDELSAYASGLLDPEMNETPSLTGPVLYPATGPFARPGGAPEGAP